MISPSVKNTPRTGAILTRAAERLSWRAVSGRWESRSRHGNRFTT